MQKTFSKQTRSPNVKELHKKQNEIMNVENTAVIQKESLEEMFSGELQIIRH